MTDLPQASQSHVHVRFYAAAREAAGAAEVWIEPLDCWTLATLAQDLVRTCGPELQPVLRASSFLVDGSALTLADHTDHSLPTTGSIDVLPPFAGG